MKNIVSFSLVFLPFFSFSQNISIGVFGGLNASYIKYEHSTIPNFKGPADSKPGHVFGISALYDLNDRIAFRTGFHMERKGGAQSIRTGAQMSASNLNTNIDYYQVPLILEASFLKDRILFFNVGYGFSFLRQAKFKSDAIEPMEPITDWFEKVDYNFLMGLGTKINCSKKLIFIFEGRWQSGLIDVFKNDVESGKNRSVFSAVGLRYKLN